MDDKFYFSDAPCGTAATDTADLDSVLCALEDHAIEHLAEETLPYCLRDTLGCKDCCVNTKYLLNYLLTYLCCFCSPS